MAHKDGCNCGDQGHCDCCTPYRTDVVPPDIQLGGFLPLKGDEKTLEPQKSFPSYCNKSSDILDLCSDFRNIYYKLEDKFHFGVDIEQRDNTPIRLQKMYFELLQGYEKDPEEILSKRFEAVNEDMVIVKDIPFTSLCAHHWLPFMGTCSVGYIPNKNEIVGLSKIPRLVNCFSRRFQVQENMTAEIADALQKYLKPRGCIVITKARHLCAEIRGVQTKNSEMISSAVRGCFDKKDLKDEFLSLLKA